jgi:hypothetical protein
VHILLDAQGTLFDTAGFHLTQAVPADHDLRDAARGQTLVEPSDTLREHLLQRAQRLPELLFGYSPIARRRDSSDYRSNGRELSSKEQSPG